MADDSEPTADRNGPSRPSAPRSQTALGGRPVPRAILGGIAKPALVEIEKRLWNQDVSAAAYEGAGEKYRAAILEQYKLYVEMADRISARRGLANTFFLTLNTALFTLFGVFWKDKPAEPSDIVLVLILVVLLGQCAAWWLLIRSYRLLNGAKFEVVGLLEKRLPASPYWSAEWKALGEGRDWRLYLPLSHAEAWVPFFFAAAYAAGFVIAVW